MVRHSIILLILPFFAYVERGDAEGERPKPYLGEPCRRIRSASASAWGKRPTL